MGEIPVDADPDFREHLVVLSKHLGQHVEEGSLIGADGKRAHGNAIALCDCTQGAAAERQQLAGILQNDLASRSEPDGFCRPVKEPVPVLLLQLTDLGTHRGLRTQYFLGRARKTAQLGDFHKRIKLIEIHTQFPSC